MAMAMMNMKRRHPTVGILRIRMVLGEKDLGFIKIEGTPDETIVVWTNTLLKDARPGARVIVGVKDVYEEEPKGIIIQIFRGKSPEMEERIGKVSILHFVCLFICSLLFPSHRSMQIAAAGAMLLLLLLLLLLQATAIAVYMYLFAEIIRLSVLTN